MDEAAKPTKKRFLKAQFAVVVCIVCVLLIKSCTIDIDGVKAGVLKQVVKIDRDNADAHLFLADYYADPYYYEEAILGFEEAIRINPDDAIAYFKLGEIHYYLGNGEEAIEAFKEAIRINPDNAEAHLNLVRVYLEMGNKDLPLEEYKILKNLDEELAKELHGFINQ